MSDEGAGEQSEIEDRSGRLHPVADVGEADATPPAVRPPVGATCEKCGCTTVAAMPYFAAGSGLAFRPMANDICCQRCGHIGPADFV